MVTPFEVGEAYTAVTTAAKYVKSLFEITKDVKVNEVAIQLQQAILDLQTTYRRYLANVPGPHGPTAPGPTTLLDRDVVLQIARNCADLLISYGTRGPDESICRESQFRAIATALSLCKLLGVEVIVHRVYHEIRQSLQDRNQEIENRQDNYDMTSFGDSQLLIRYSLSFLSDMPSDRGRAFARLRAISNIFFAAGLIVSD